MMGECLVGQWVVGVISFQKIFGLYGLERHIVEKRWGVTLVDGQRKCEDRARILKQNSQYSFCGELSNNNNFAGFADANYFRRSQKVHSNHIFGVGQSCQVLETTSHVFKIQDG